MIYLCRTCGAYVGVHDGTDIALGRLANKELRVAKIKAHHVFDQIFRGGFINKIWPEKLPDTTNRKKAYKWLAKQMNIDEELCHIGMFDINDCNRVVEICESYLKEKPEAAGTPYTGFESGKMREAKKEIIGLGFDIIFQTEKEIHFLFKENIVRYYPDTGWHSGKSIKDGRGLNNLLHQLVT